MSVVTAIEEAGPCRVKVTIEVPAPAVDAEVGRVIQHLRKSANIRGFRKGKVPVSLIRKRFWAEIEHEVLDRLLPRYWQQAQAEKNLDPLLPPSIGELKVEAGQPLTVVAEVETRPEISLGDVDTFDLPEESVTASDSDIDDGLTELRRNFATWDVVDRPAGQGDLIIGSITEAGDDSEDPERPLHVEIGGQGVEEEMSLALTDKSAGQTVEYERTETSENEDGEEETQKKTFELKIREVKEQTLPELTDELAKEVGGFETVDDLRQAMASNITNRKTSDLQRRRQEALLQQLRERHPLTLPEQVVQKEAESMIQEYAENLSRHGADLSKMEMDWGSIADSFKPQAENRVHERLLLDAIADEKDLRLDEEQFENILTDAARQQGTNSQALRQQLSESGRLEGLRAQLLRDQALRHLLGETDEEDEDGDSEDSEE